MICRICKKEIVEKGGCYDICWSCWEPLYGNTTDITGLSTVAVNKDYDYNSESRINN